jgi:16S rRNA (cytosine967-C5)-methyltransferase
VHAVIPSARPVAADVLRRSRQREAFAGELIDQAVGGLSPQDRRLVTQLVMGVLRRRATLDALIAPFLTRPFRDLHPDTLDLLRLGAFQLAFLTHVPKHAAVHETVAVTPPVVKKFVNAVLRKIADVVTDEFTDEMGADAVPFGEPRPPGSGTSRTPLPGGRGSYRKLTRPLLPDSATDFPAYLAAAVSWPRWLADRWLARHGRDECVRLGFWFNAPPPLWLRVNAMKTERSDYLLQLAANNVAAEPGEHPQAVRLLDGANIRELPGYDRGEFAVQDHSSMLVASALNPQPGWSVLDLCAAPGGKTTQLAELMKNAGRIVACDIVPKRLDTVTALCQRLGVSIVEPAVLKDGSDPQSDAPTGPFDAALVDVPCSNTGVLGRRPEVRWRLDPAEFPHLVRLQTRLLTTALERVRPGGIVVYSTCSIEPDENGGVVRAVLRELRGVTLEAEHTSIPGRPSDGGYWARLRKA